MSTFGPVDFAGETGIVEIQAVCSDGSVTVYSGSVFVPAECSTCTFTASPGSVSGPPGTATNLSATATGPFFWETSPTPIGPWSVGTPPATIADGSGTQYWRACCVSDPSTCSATAAIVEQPIGGGNLQDRLIEVPDQGTVGSEFCADCPNPTWEVRIAPARDQFNSPTPVDPGIPNPDDQWVLVDEVQGSECIGIAIQEQWLDGLDNGSDRFYLWLRADCSGVITDAVITIEV